MESIKAIRAADLTRTEIGAWTALQERNPGLDSPFFRPEFTLAVDQVHNNTEIGVVKNNREIVGLLPFQRIGTNVGRPVGWRVSDLHGMVADEDVVWDMKRCLRELKLSAWHFDHLPATQRSFQSYHSIVEDSPYIELDAGYEAYETHKREAGSSTIRQAMRKARKLSREVGPVRFRLHTSEEQIWRALVNWKQAQLSRAGYLNFFRNTQIMKLLSLVKRAEFPKFSGVVSALYAGNEAVAVHLGIRSQNVLASWIPTYNPKHKKYSPGLILHIELIKAAAKTGTKRIDLGRGENPLKTSLMTGALPVAIGCVDLRPIHRILRARWCTARGFVHASPLSGKPMQYYRRIRSAVVENHNHAFLNGD